MLHRDVKVGIVLVSFALVSWVNCVGRPAVSDQLLEIQLFPGAMVNDVSHPDLSCRGNTWPHISKTVMISLVQL